MTVVDDRAHYFATATTLYHVQPIWESSGYEVTAYSIRTGLVEAATRKVAIGFSQKDKCDFVQSYLVCANNGEVVAFDLVSDTKKVVAKSNANPTIVQVSGNLGRCGNIFVFFFI